MKIQKSEVLIDKIDNKTLKSEISAYIDQVKNAILAIDHPIGSKSFSINPNPEQRPNKKIDKHPNGVQFIKKAFSEHLLKISGWKDETSSFGSNIKYKNLRSTDAVTGWGPLDFSIIIKSNKDVTKNWGPLSTGTISEFVTEWETGNVSSSHRAINKMISAIYFSTVVGGILVVPTAEIKHYLTDRIGNYEELEPYFPFWKIQSENPHFKQGYLEIIGVTYDKLDTSIPYLPKGADGNAFRFAED